VLSVGFSLPQPVAPGQFNLFPALSVVTDIAAVARAKRG